MKKEELTKKELKQVELWVQEAEFRYIFCKNYGMTISDKKVKKWSKLKQTVFLQVANQMQDAEDIKQAILQNNPYVAAVLSLPYDDGKFLTKCMSKSLELKQKSEPTKEE